MPKVIALAQQKGGVGKSTLAIHMGCEIARRGHRVAIVDLDPQGTVTKWQSRRSTPWPIVIPTTVAKLSETLAGLQGNDFIVLDLPGRRGPDVTAGLRAADLILVPARPLDIDIEASGETIATAQRLRKRYAFVMTAAPFGGRRATDFIGMIRQRGLPVISAIIQERFAYPDAINAGLGVNEYAPKGAANIEMSLFTTEVLKELS